MTKSDIPGMGVARKIQGGYEVVFERQVPHLPKDVWAMLTESENIEKWFCARVDIDRRLGGRMVEHHDHVGVDVQGQVTRWEPPRVFEHTWWFGSAEAAPMGTACWELVTESSSTRLVLTHRRQHLDPGGMSGAHAYLDVLCAVLDGADPRSHSAPEGEFHDGRFVETRPGRGRWADRELLEQAYKQYFSTL